MAKRLIAAGRLFGSVGPARLLVAPGEDVVGTYATWMLGAGGEYPARDSVFDQADVELMAIVHESRSRRRG